MTLHHDYLTMRKLLHARMAEEVLAAEERLLMGSVDRWDKTNPALQWVFHIYSRPLDIEHRIANAHHALLPEIIALYAQRQADEEVVARTCPCDDEEVTLIRAHGLEHALRRERRGRTHKWLALIDRRFGIDLGSQYHALAFDPEYARSIHIRGTLADQYPHIVRADGTFTLETLVEALPPIHRSITHEDVLRSGIIEDVGGMYLIKDPFGPESLLFQAQE